MSIDRKRNLYCAFHYHADSKIQSSSDRVVFRYCQSNVRRLLPASDYFRALFGCLNCGSTIWLPRTRPVGSWEGPPNIWLTVAKNAFVRWALNFRVRMLLKGAVTNTFRKKKKSMWESSLHQLTKILSNFKSRWANLFPWMYRKASKIFRAQPNTFFMTASLGNRAGASSGWDITWYLREQLHSSRIITTVVPFRPRWRLVP